MSDVQTVLFEHAGVTLCRFRCPAHHDRWQRENQIVDGHNVAFPELPVEIRHAGDPGMLVDPTRAVFYNFGDPYQRRINHSDGDSANIFLFDADLLVPALAPYVPDADPAQPLSIRFGPVSAVTYLKQRLLLAHVSQWPASDPSWVFEQAIEILDEVLASGYTEVVAKPARAARARRRDRDRVEAVKRLIVERCDQPMSLSELAAGVGASVYYLCRTFRRSTGHSIHAYRQRIRLRAGLVLLETTDTPLSGIALDVGFAHQSHFTEAFRRAYGLPPGRVRRLLTSKGKPIGEESRRRAGRATTTRGAQS